MSAFPASHLGVGDVKVPGGRDFKDRGFLTARWPRATTNRRAEFRVPAAGAGAALEE